MKKPITFLFIAALVAIIYGFSTGDKNPSDRNTDSRPNGNINYLRVEQGAPQTLFSSSLSESFEGALFPPTGWTKINVIANTTGWERQTSGVTPIPGFNGGTLFCPPGGGTAMAFCNYITGSAGGGATGPIDQWLVTPQITNVQPSDSLTFWLRKFGNYPDNIHVRISTTTPTAAAMTVVVSSLVFSAVDSGYIQYKYPIGTLVPSGSNIYIGIRNWVTNAAIDGATMSLDLFNVTANTTGITHNGTEIPASYNLAQNYPNPFNPSTTINFSLPKSGHVKLAVYDMVGNEVEVLLDANESAGNYSASYNASKLASGVYFYRLITSDYTQTRKMILVK